MKPASMNAETAGISLNRQRKHTALAPTHPQNDALPVLNAEQKPGASEEIKKTSKNLPEGRFLLSCEKLHKC